LIYRNDRPGVARYAGLTMSRISTLIVASLLGSTLAACGGSGQSEPPAGGSASPAATSPAPAAAPAVVHDGRKIEITADDKMKFSVVEIAATPGERLSVTLVNKGTTPKFSMGHNWLLLVAGVDVGAFLIAAAEAPTTDIPAAGANGGQSCSGPAGHGHVQRASAPGRYRSVPSPVTRRSACRAC
jgi:hypothetical protein